MIGDQVHLNALNKKRKGLLIIVFVSIFIVLATITTVMLVGVEEVYVSLISILLLVALLIEILFIKPRVTYYAMEYRYYTLMMHSVKPYHVKENFNSDWLNKILQQQFTYAHKHDVFDVLYRISKPIERSAFAHNHMLEIITIIKDNQIDFYSDMIDDVYKRIWRENQAKYRISKQVILQFKKYQEFTETTKEELDRIIAYREGKNYLITINCGYFEKDHLFYFLHAKQYHPNLYYKYGCELIEKIVV